MAEYTADKLMVEIDSSSKDATQSIGKLISALKHLKENTNGFGNPVKKMASGLDAVSDSAKDTEDALDDVGKAVERTEKKMNGLSKGLRAIKRIFAYRLIRSAIREIGQAFNEGIGNLYQWSAIVGNNFKPAMDSMATSALYAKNSLGAMVAPILEALAPAIEKITELFVRATEAVSQFFATLTGSSYYYRAKRNMTEYAKETGKASKALKDFTLAFDELNVISQNDSGGGASTPDFSEMFEKMELTDDIKQRMNEILNIVGLVGAAFAGWKIGKALGLDIERIIGLVGGLLFELGFVQDIFDMWKNGIDLNNLIGALALATGAALLFGIAFGKAAAGLVLVVDGAILFITAIRDAIENGWNFYNTMGACAALLMTGLGLSLITNSFIPLFISAVLAAGLAMAVFTGRGEELLGEFKKVWQGVSDFVRDVIVRKDMQAAGEDLKLIFEGVVNSVIIIFEGFINLIITGINELFKKEAEMTNKFLNSLPDWMTGGKTFNAQAGQIPLISLGRVSFTDKSTGYIDRQEESSLAAESSHNAFKTSSLANEFAGAGEAAASSFAEQFMSVIGGSDIGGALGTALGADKVGENFSDVMANVKKDTEDFAVNGKEYIKDFTDVSNNDLNSLKNDIDSYINDNSDLYKVKLSGAEGHTKTATTNMTNAYNTMSNNSVSAIGRIISALNSIPTHITTVHTIIEERKSGGSNLASVPAYANGGFVDSGELFLAREAGAEMVGRIGNRTAVANNQDIVAGVASGVADGNEDVVDRLNALIRVNEAILAKTGYSIDGKTLMTSVERAQRNRGANIMAGGVML